MQTMYLILVEKSGAEDGLSTVELMFYNSILSLPFLFFIIIATGEFPHSLSVLSEKVSNILPIVHAVAVWSMYFVHSVWISESICTLCNSWYPQHLFLAF